MKLIFLSLMVSSVFIKTHGMQNKCIKKIRFDIHGNSATAEKSANFITYSVYYKWEEQKGVMKAIETTNASTGQKSYYAEEYYTILRPNDTQAGKRKKNIITANATGQTPADKYNLLKNIFDGFSIEG